MSIKEFTLETISPLRADEKRVIEIKALNLCVLFLVREGTTGVIFTPLAVWRGSCGIITFMPCHHELSERSEDGTISTSGSFARTLWSRWTRGQFSCFIIPRRAFLFRMEIAFVDEARNLHRYGKNLKWKKKLKNFNNIA